MISRREIIILGRNPIESAKLRGRLIAGLVKSGEINYLGWNIPIGITREIIESSVLSSSLLINHFTRVDAYVQFNYRKSTFHIHISDVSEIFKICEHCHYTSYKLVQIVDSILEIHINECYVYVNVTTSVEEMKVIGSHDYLPHLKPD